MSDVTNAGDRQSRIEDRLAAPVSALGYDLEGVSITKAGKRSVLRVAVDRDGGVDLDDVAELTREISEILDDEDLMGAAPYTLEVGSPGVDRPLTLPRHWRRNRTRLVKARLTDGSEIVARVVGTDDSDEATVTLDVDGVERTIPLSDIDKATVQIEFKRPDAAEED